MVTPKVALKVNVVALGFGREGLIVGLSCLLLRVTTLARLIVHLLDCPVKHAFENADCIDWVLGDILGQLWVLPPQIIDRD